MSEEQPEEQMGTDSEAPAENAAQEPIGSEEEMELLPDGEAMETAEESRFGRFFKRALRWVVVVLVIFTLGVVAMQIVRVGPLTDERNSLDQSLAEAQATRQDLQAEIDRLQGVEAENEELAGSLQQSEARLAVLNILVDITRAQLALAQEDTAGVAAALQETGEKLNLLRDLVGADELTGLRERLVLVLSEVDGDPFAAERDLEILANTLLAIELELATD
jgi:cell division protein FtsB